MVQHRHIKPCIYRPTQRQELKHSSQSDNANELNGKEIISEAYTSLVKEIPAFVESEVSQVWKYL